MDRLSLRIANASGLAALSASLLACGGSAAAPAGDGGADVLTMADASMPDQTSAPDGPTADARPSDASLGDSSMVSDSPVDVAIDAPPPPPPILVQAHQPTGIAVDMQYIFWGDWGGNGGAGPSIWRADLDGSNVTLITQDGATLAFPEDVALSGDSVYWDGTGASSSGQPPIVRCPKAGCSGPAEGLPSVGPFSYGTGMALGDAGFFWAGNYGASSTSVGFSGVWRVQPADAGPSGDIAQLPLSVSGPGSLALDTSSVYFGEVGGVVGAIAADAPLLPPDAGGSFTQLAQLARGDAGFFWNDYDPPSLFVDDTTIYYAWGNGDVVGALPKSGAPDGGLAPVYAWNVGGAMRIVADASDVYWTVRGPNTNDAGNELVYSDGSIMKCPKTGCGASGPTVLATGLDGLSGYLAVDASYVYFTQFADGTIRRVPK
jgi:hypothetical protein